MNGFFLTSAAVIATGALLAAEGHVRVGLIFLALGVPSLLIFTVRSLVR